MNELYQAYKSAILTGFGLIQVEAADIFLLLAAISGFMIFISFLISPKDINTTTPLAWGVVAIGLGVFIDAFPSLSDRFMAGMWEVGSSATGGAGLSDFEDFDGLLLSGYQMAKPIISSLHGWSLREIWNNAWDWTMGWICVGILIGCNAYLAFRLFIVMLSYLPLTLAAMISLPAMLWNKTTSLGETALKFCAGTGISVLGFGLVLSIVWNVASGIQFLADGILSDTLINMAKVTIGFVMALKTQSLIQGYFSGMPNFSSGIGGTIRSGFYAMSMAGALMKAGALVNSIGGNSSHGPSTYNNAPPTNPNINSGGTGSSNNTGFGGNWRQSGGVQNRTRP